MLLRALFREQWLLWLHEITVLCINRCRILEEHGQCYQAMLTDVPHCGKSRVRSEVFISLLSTASWSLIYFNVCVLTEYRFVS